MEAEWAIEFNIDWESIDDDTLPLYCPVPPNLQPFYSRCVSYTTAHSTSIPLHFTDVSSWHNPTHDTSIYGQMYGLAEEAQVTCSAILQHTNSSLRPNVCTNVFCCPCSCSTTCTCKKMSSAANSGCRRSCSQHSTSNGTPIYGQIYVPLLQTTVIASCYSCVVLSVTSSVRFS